MARRLPQTKLLLLGRAADEKVFRRKCLFIRLYRLFELLLLQALHVDDAGSIVGCKLRVDKAAIFIPVELKVGERILLRALRDLLLNRLLGLDIFYKHLGVTASVLRGDSLLRLLVVIDFQLKGVLDLVHRLEAEA